MPGHVLNKFMTALPNPINRIQVPAHYAALGPTVTVWFSTSALFGKEE